MKHKKKRPDKYEKKVKIKGTFNEVLKVLVSSPAPNLKKRHGNKPSNKSP